MNEDFNSTEDIPELYATENIPFERKIIYQRYIEGIKLRRLDSTD